MLSLETVLPTAGERELEYAKVSEKLLKDLHQFFSIDEKIEKKSRMLVLLSSLPSSFESLVTAHLAWKSTIKMKEVPAALLQNEIFKQENRALSSGGNLALPATESAGGKGRSDKGS